MNYEDAMRVKAKTQSRYPKAKLSMEIANTIRQRYLDEDISLADFALEYDVAMSTIRQILHNKLYKIPNPNEEGDK